MLCTSAGRGISDMSLNIKWARSIKPKNNLLANGKRKFAKSQHMSVTQPFFPELKTV